MILDAALAYALRGLPVFPVRGKLPLTEHGCKDASTDADTIRGWWSRFPDANIALPTGVVSGLAVLDIDVRHGGDESLAELGGKHGPLPETLESRTGGGGRHFFFSLADGRVIRNSAGKLGPGLDVRGEGGYVVVPPSIHPETRKPYVWANKAEPILPPAWLMKALSAPVSASGSVSDAPIPAGQRNDTLVRIAGAMRRKGCTQAAIEAALLAENTRRCSPPLPEGEVRAIAQSVSRYVPERLSAGETRNSEAGAVLRCFSDITPKPLRWLWAGRIPLGKLTLLIGDPGLGKSLLTIDVASRVARGTSFPDGAACESGSVIFLSAEDDAADTIRPRLDAAGADVSCVHILEAVRVQLTNGSLAEKTFNLETDCAALEGAVRQHPDVRLIVIDPISAYLGGVDSHSNAEVRGLLAPLVALAARFGVAVLCVTHLRKSAGAAIYRAISSIAFAAAARAVWAVAPDPEDGDRRILLAVKQNLSANAGGLAFHIETQNNVPRLAWEPGAVVLAANEVLGIEVQEDQNEKREAKEWLKDFLADGPVAVKKIQQQAKAAGLSWATVRRAKEKLPVLAGKDGYQGPWEWRLEDAQPKDAQLKRAHPIDTQVSTFEQLIENSNLNDKRADKDAHPTDVNTFGDDGEVRL